MRSNLEIGAIGVRLMVLNRMNVRGEPLERMKVCINSLFYLLNHDVEKRDYLPDGYKRFCIGYSCFMEEFRHLESLEECEAFFDKLYVYLCDCFPITLVEVK